MLNRKEFKDNDETRKAQSNCVAVALLIMILVGCLVAAWSLSGCNYTINLIHTQGTADDVVDETQTSEPDIKTDLTIPLH